MKIFIFVLCFTAFVCGVAKADIESSSDKDNVTTTSGNVTLPNKDVNVTDANVGEDKKEEEEEEAESKVEEADEGQLEARDTTLNLNHTSSSNTTDVDDDEDKSNANVTAKETHDESDKTEKRHAVYNVYYTGAGQSQQLQQTTTPHSIYSYVDFRQSRRYADTIPGVEGRDYPIFATVPPTSFSCAGRSIGLYGDVEARCQVWHNCQLDGRRDAFLCPNGTLFNQQVLVCDWWYNVECETTPSYYGINTQLVQQSSVGRQASYQGYRQQVNRYQDAAGTTGYYYNYQKPFYVQTTAYPTSYYFGTGSGAAYSGARSAASSSSTAAAAAGSSFVATNNLYGGNGAGYYYRPSYQRVEGGGNVGLGGYGYTVSTHTPGYVTMRYDIPGGHYSSNSAASAGSSSGGGFQYQYSTGQLPSSLAVPTVTGSLNTGSRVQYSQRVSGGDRPDHPNYNEKSGYNYRPPQIPIPTPVRPPQPVAPPTTTTAQIYSVTDTKLVQPKISIPIQPIRVATQTYNVVDHPNANEKSGYVRPQVSVPAPTAPRGSQGFNYEFSTYGANQNAQIPVVRQPAPVAPTGTGYSYSTYNKVSESVHPNANEKSGYVQPNVRPTQGGGSQTTNYAFSTYESNRNVQIPTIKQTPLATVVTTSHGQSSAAAQSSTYSHSSYNAGVELVHPNANEKSGYAQTSGGSQRGGSQTTNYAFSTYNSNGNVQYPVIKAKPIPVSTGGQSTYSFSTYNTGVDHPNANEKSAFTSPPVIPVTQPPLRVTQPPIRVTQPPIRVPKPTIRVTHDPIDHPNYNEKSGYNQRPIPVGPQYPPGIFVPKVVISPPDVQVDCTGAYTCRPASPSVQVQPDYETAHVNFGQRVEATVSGGSGSGSVAASDRSAGAVQQQDNGGYY